MIADMRVFELGEELLVDLDGTLAQSVADRWSQFIFSEDVQVRNVSASTAEVGIYGPRAAAVLSAALRSGGATTDAAFAADAPGLARLPVYATVGRVLGGHQITLLASDEIGVMGFDLVMPRDMRSELVELLHGSGALDVSAEAAHICRVEAGRPLFLTDMDEDTIPLEAGIEDRAISLTKGCYVGQEIIIRVLHRGQGRVARKLVGFTLSPGTALPSAGARVAAGAREIGSVTSSAESPALERPIAMGYVHRDFVAARNCSRDRRHSRVGRGASLCSRYPARVAADHPEALAAGESSPSTVRHRRRRPRHRAGSSGVLGQTAGDRRNVRRYSARPVAARSLSPSIEARLFPAASLPPLHLISQLGVVLFMFVVGMEVDFDRLRRRARATLVISNAGIVVPFALGMLLSVYLHADYAPAGFRFCTFALFIGIAMSITAFPVLARIITERGLRNRALGTWRSDAPQSTT